MASKATVKRQKSAEKVMAAGRTHKETIARKMGGLYGEEIIPATEMIVDKTVDDLSAKTEAMVRADDAHQEELRTGVRGPNRVRGPDPGRSGRGAPAVQGRA